MKANHLFILLIWLLSIHSLKAQNEFAPGYYINNQSDSVPCLIKVLDWQNNPQELQFKRDQTSQTQELGIAQIKEFGISGVTFQRYKVEIDLSSNAANSLTSSAKPTYQQQELLLKVLVKGSASLYEYRATNVTQFFYTLDEQPITTLAYKRYLTQDRTIAVNNSFRHQLITQINCTTISVQDVQHLEYRRSDLINYFVKYNSCINPSFTYNKAEYNHQRKLVNLTIRPGLNSSGLFFSTSLPSERNADISRELGFRLGLEAEVKLPSRGNLWSLFFELAYQSYQAENTLVNLTSLSTGQPDTDQADVSFHRLNIPIGVRHTISLPGNNAVFINGAFAFDIALDGTIAFESFEDLELDPVNGFVALGAGYQYRQRYLLEFRYSLKGNLLNDQSSWDSDFDTLELIFGYKVF